MTSTSSNSTMADCGWSLRLVREAPSGSRFHSDRTRWRSPPEPARLALSSDDEFQPRAVFALQPDLVRFLSTLFEGSYAAVVTGSRAGNSGVRMAELMATLSMATDLGMGQPLETALPITTRSFGTSAATR